MASLWSLLAITVFAVVLGVCHGKLCFPDCSGMREGDKVPDPTNCFRYYYCSDPEGTGELIHSSDPLDCPEGYYFNSELHILECEPIVPENMHCTSLCNPCEVKCTMPGTLVPSVTDCGMFKICLDDGDTIDDFCPTNLPYFDYETGLCSQSSDVCYDLCDSCQLYCTHEGKVPDPLDCGMYYYCDPPLLSHFDCPGEEVFNPDTLVCEESLTGNCTTLC
ncbi:uncharacterized protein LOC122246634 [Penaeus japonicus]|uniref:uncharacterized protein LOC122246634 n=1 Tax=Penaeus japonicus TaxID=27405 RepID=UPI001C70EFFE|nr:uncharacterized protein LOC122246634 [Penaeus japonicus]